MKVIVYSKPDCVKCNLLKQELEENGIPYLSVDVSQDEESLELLKQYEFKGLPVVAMDSLKNAWAGFNPDRLEELVTLFKE